MAKRSKIVFYMGLEPDARGAVKGKFGAHSLAARAYAEAMVDPESGIRCVYVRRKDGDVWHPFDVSWMPQFGSWSVSYFDGKVHKGKWKMEVPRKAVVKAVVSENEFADALRVFFDVPRRERRG